MDKGSLPQIHLVYVLYVHVDTISVYRKCSDHEVIYSRSADDSDLVKPPRSSQVRTARALEKGEVVGGAAPIVVHQTLANRNEVRDERVNLQPINSLSFLGGSDRAGHSWTKSCGLFNGGVGTQEWCIGTWHFPACKQASNKNFPAC